MSEGSSYPTGAQYRETLQHPNACFKDPILAGGKMKTDHFGLPKPISGNYASVFTVEGVDGKTWAVKCFTRYAANQQMRYQYISETLSKLYQPWLVPFDYVPEGILCLGVWYPVLRMEWVEATGLINFIEAHLSEPKVLSDLASKFLQMNHDMASAGIAHGDLQHGNLLVTSAGELKLIDYDGMYVPGLVNLGASEIGHANYQSPIRSMKHWGSYLDRFSAWIIYGSLIALAVDPSLWTRFHHDGVEALILGKGDYLAPEGSLALAALAQNSDSRLWTLSQIWTQSLASNLDAIPILDSTVLPKRNVGRQFAVTTQSTTLSEDGDKDLSVLIDDWLKSIESAAPGTLDTAIDPTWILANLPPVPRVAFKPQCGGPRLMYASGLILIIVLIVLVDLSAIRVADAGIGGVALIIVVLGLSQWWYNRLDVVRKKRQCLHHLNQQAGLVKRSEYLAATVEKERQLVDVRERRAVAGFEKRVKETRDSESKLLQEAEARSAREIAKVEAKLNSLMVTESLDISSRLQILQNSYIADQLRASTIQSTTIQGIGDSLKMELVRCGIRTAADFTGIFRGSNSQVYIIMRNGAHIHPKGIGETKARSLENWRQATEKYFRQRQPMSLPTAELQMVQAKYLHQRQSLNSQESALRSLIVAQRQQFHDQSALRIKSLNGELADLRKRCSAERIDFDIRAKAIRREVSAAVWSQAKAELDYRRFREVTFMRYLVCAFRG